MTILARNTDTVVIGLFLISIVLAIIGIFLNSKLLVYESVIFIILDIFFIWFFRDPERIPHGSEDDIISPADGKVIDIRGKTVCIFMNMHHVHVNRAPITGKIIRMNHKNGGYLPAFFKDSNRNERNTIYVESKYGTVKVVQIAGTITRRIDTYFNVGDKIVRGERIGMIRFGSRVDITPPEGYILSINKGDSVKAAISIIARRNFTKEDHNSSAGV